MDPDIDAMTPLLQVHDMMEALAFYRDVLGFTVVNASEEIDAPEGRYAHWVWLRLGPANLMLNTAYDQGERPLARNAARQHWHKDTCLYFSCRDVDALHQSLRLRLPHLKSPVNMPYGMRQLHLSDPDGYGLCFQAPVGAAD